MDDGESRYHLLNKGNTVLVIDEFKDCVAHKENDCKPTTKHHVKSGQSFSFDKEVGREYRFTLVEGSQKKSIEIKG
jgi:hypothetical protein